MLSGQSNGLPYAPRLGPFRRGPASRPSFGNLVPHTVAPTERGPLIPNGECGLRCVVVKRAEIDRMGTFRTGLRHQGGVNGTTEDVRSRRRPPVSLGPARLSILDLCLPPLAHHPPNTGPERSGEPEGYTLVFQFFTEPHAVMPTGTASTSSSSRWRVVTFVAKVLAFYGLWYVAYDLWLLPDGTVDRWLSLNVASVAGALMEGMGFEVLVEARALALPDVRGVRIANGCNGLSTLGLFVGFVLAYPGRAWRRVWFVPLGILAIYATNVGRIVVMLLTQRYWPAAFDPLHGFGLTTIFYVVVFGLWVAWAHYGGASAASTESPADPPPDQAPAVSPS